MSTYDPQFDAPPHFEDFYAHYRHILHRLVTVRKAADR